MTTSTTKMNSYTQLALIIALSSCLLQPAAASGWLTRQVTRAANWVGNKMKISGEYVPGNLEVTGAGSPEVNGVYEPMTSGVPPPFEKCQTCCGTPGFVNGKKCPTCKFMPSKALPMAGRLWYQKISGEKDYYICCKAFMEGKGWLPENSFHWAVCGFNDTTYYESHLGEEADLREITSVRWRFCSGCGEQSWKSLPTMRIMTFQGIREKINKNIEDRERQNDRARRRLRKFAFPPLDALARDTEEQ